MSEKNKYFNASDQPDKIVQQSDYVHQSNEEEIEQLKNDIKQAYVKYDVIKREIDNNNDDNFKYPFIYKSAVGRITYHFYNCSIINDKGMFCFDDAHYQNIYKTMIESKHPKDEENVKLLQELDKNIKTKIIKTDNIEMKIKIINEIIEDIKIGTKGITTESCLDSLQQLINLLEEYVKRMISYKLALEKASDAYIDMQLKISFLYTKRQRLMKTISD